MYRRGEGGRPLRRVLQITGVSDRSEGVEVQER